MSANVMDRREFLTLCTACAVVPLVGACASMNYVPGLLDSSGRVLVAKSEFIAKPFALVDAPGIEFPLYVHQHGTDDYSAVLTRCMHRGCTVEPTEGRLVCPCHGSEYTNVGAVLKGPTELPLVRFPVTLDAENIYIDVTRALS
ncbi:MAG: QcrA and Rieske domain-containing protein [Gemmatimonadaceae bacterium]